MALGTLGTALATSAITAGANYGLSKLMGGSSEGSSATSFTPPGISAGGLSSSMGSKGIEIKSSPYRRALVADLAGASGEQAGLLAELRGRVAPGISELRASRLSEIENARQSAIGNLRENLQRRRVLGSSFGNDAITRAESEFAGQRERVAAESFLQELEASNNLINQEFTVRRQQFQTGLDELNLQADLATKLAGAATTQMGANARLQAELDAKEAAGAGKFFGETIAPFTKQLGTSLGSMFKAGPDAVSLMPASI